MDDTILPKEKKRRIEVPIVYVTQPRQLIVKSTEKKKKLRKVLTIPLSRTSKQKRREKMSMLI